jgi:glycosyltransferase involved in cell wall biosynthesis
MLIGYDGRFITEKTTGNGIYATRLIEALSLVDDHNHYRLYMVDQDPRVTLELRKNVEIRIMHPFHRSAWLRVPILFPWELYCRPVDIFHAHYTVPMWIRTKVVLTLHDFFWIIHPEHFISWKRIPLSRVVKRSVACADRILVGTSFMQRETVDYFKVPEGRVKVIPYGVDPQFFSRTSEDQRARLRKKYGIEKPYILAVGDIHPRKNLGRLLEAFIALPEHHDVNLVLVGKPLWKAGDLFKQIKKAGLEDQVVATGYVPDEEMPGLYQGAEVFCYPSLYEGFGFPILEAMASGVPVVASETSSCPEVGGPAALYFDPLREESITESIHRILTSSEHRSKQIEAGSQWVRRFSWEETARRTVDVYQELG